MSGEEIFRILERKRLPSDELLRMYWPLEWAAAHSRQHRQERATIQRFLAEHESEPAVGMLRELLDDYDELRFRV